MSRFAVFITVRTSSRRLPGKTLLPIGERTVFEHIVDRALAVRNVDDVVVCTSTDPADDELERLAIPMGAKVHRGALEDKPDRWLGAARAHRMDYFISYDGDDLFCDPELMESAVEWMRRHPSDFQTFPKDVVVGGAASCVSIHALERLQRLVGEPIDNPWLLFTAAHGFKATEFEVADPVFYAPRTRLTLDYEEDLLFFRRVFAEMSITRNRVPLRQILQFLATRADLTEINWFRQQDYLNNQIRLAEGIESRTTAPPTSRES